MAHISGIILALKGGGVAHINGIILALEGAPSKLPLGGPPTLRAADRRPGHPPRFFGWLKKN